jgi:hypothetical protein
MKQQFEVDNSSDEQRCIESFRFRTPITISGRDVLTGDIKAYTGIVIGVESSSGRPSRISIEDSESTPDKS